MRSASYAKFLHKKTRISLDRPYHLHNLYNAFENIFQNIAAVFENLVEDEGRWHAQLLERMGLDAMPLRPAVIDDTAYDGMSSIPVIEMMPVVCGLHRGYVETMRA